jgi:hypothetical protein
MAGYIGKSQGVTQVDGYTADEADSEFVNDPNAALNISSSASADSATIDASGRLLVGTTDTGLGTTTTSEGHLFQPDGAAVHARDGVHPLILNRLTSDGDIAVFRKDGTTVGSIGTDSGDLYIGTGDTGVRFRDAGDDILPFNTSTGADRDAAVDLGDASSRFKNLYLSGGVYLGGTGSANHLDDYEVGDWSSTSITTGSGVTTGGTMEGRYRKVGNIVHIFGIVSGVTASTGRRYIVLSGLPFVQYAGYPNAMGICSNYPQGNSHGHGGIVIDNTSGNNDQWYIEWYNDIAQSNSSVTFSLTYETS